MDIESAFITLKWCIIGLLALSVLKAIKFLTLYLFANLSIFSVPLILISTAYSGFLEAISIYLRAAQ